MKKILIILCLLLIPFSAYAILRGSGGGGSCAGVACDDFNRSDGNLTSPWETMAPSSAVTISSNVVAASAAGSNMSADSGTYSTNQYSQIVVSNISATIGDSGLVIHAITNGTDTRSALMLEIGSGGWVMSSYTNNSYAVAVSEQTKTISNNDVIKFWNEGNTMYVSFNGGAAEATTGDATDHFSVVGTGGKPGIQFYNTSTARLDDWEGGDI